MPNVSRARLIAPECSPAGGLCNTPPDLAKPCKCGQTSQHCTTHTEKDGLCIPPCWFFFVVHGRLRDFVILAAQGSCFSCSHNREACLQWQRTQLLFKMRYISPGSRIALCRRVRAGSLLLHSCMHISAAVSIWLTLNFHAEYRFFSLFRLFRRCWSAFVFLEVFGQCSRKTRSASPLKPASFLCCCRRCFTPPVPLPVRVLMPLLL